MIQLTCRKRVIQAAMLGILAPAIAAFPQSAPPASDPSSQHSLLERQYKEGEKLSYHMVTSNRDRARTLHYEIQADGVVRQDANGYIEEFAWSGMVVEGKPFALPASNQMFRQVLALTPNPKLGIPDLSKVHPMMIGPITDMLTFYADMLIAKTQGKLAHAGDHFYFKHGTPNSWADGMYVTLGQDSIDFDVTLTELDQAARTATVVVKHVPPEKPEIKVPADWMKPPVADTPNNWVQVAKAGPGKFSAQIGKETFVATIKVGLSDGRILSATLVNPVEVLERECSDAALTSCGEPVRFQILRQVEIK
jgi:hypothetical protein